MQGEDVVDDGADAPPMTFNHFDSPKSQSDTKILLDGINLEDDIEKVEVSSPGSSDATIEDDFGDDAKLQLFPPIPDHQNSSESIRNWLQKISELQKKLNIDPALPNPALIFNSSDYNNVIKTNQSATTTAAAATTSSSQSNRVVKYQDLPYMGEMTLDNSKPRRGRKPKKADICHLIYKNYGTIFPGTPNPKSYTENDKNKHTTPDISKDNLSNNNNEFGSNRSDVQNRIISSLLEKRLTQELNNKSKLPSAPVAKRTDQNEPLNLCIRDMNHLKIRFMKKHTPNDTSVIKSEPHSDDDDVEFVQESSSATTTPSPLIKSEPSSASPDVVVNNGKDGAARPNGYVYWPNAGVFIHPMALQQHLMYYQRLAANNNYTLPSHSPRPPPPLNGADGAVLQSLEAQDLGRKLMPKIPATTIVRPVTIKKNASNNKVQISNNNNEETESAVVLVPETKTKRIAATSVSDKTPTKRKRSAIFIPPIPTENNTNPATEVSICKFKFTGGAKPSLQEKKMLSVDSGGNFRYYSGTGDKSMRGYEFFPRETLQQQINSSQGSSTGAFLQASGEKIYPPVDFAAVKTNNAAANHPEYLLAPEMQTQMSDARHHGSSKKRKSRKSLQREKLEQTFKEKGFLIQTQQLESAEGATYCKFRQLRKFTRYLFRSWKDYLPGNVRELQENGEKIDEEEIVGGEQEIDSLSRHSSELSNQNGQL